MIYVLLQAPNDGYYIVARATSDKHFAMVDAGYMEISNGLYPDMVEMQQNLERMEDDTILLFCEKTKSLIQTTDEMLRCILDSNPNYLNDKDFVYDN